MTVKPLVDVLIPTRNRPQLAAEAIASVQAQTLPEWRLTVVDDASTDDSAEVLSRLAEQDDRIRLVRRSTRGGPQAARQSGLSLATAPLVAALDSDDIWLPTKLERQVAAFDDAEGDGRGVDAVLSWHRWVTSDGRRRGEIRRPRIGDPVSPLFTNNMSTLLIRRDALLAAGGFLPDGARSLFTCEGFEFYIRLAASCSFAVVQGLLVICRDHPGERASARFSDGREADELAYVVALHASYLSRFRDERATLEARVAARYLRAGSRDAALRHFHAAIRGASPRERLRMIRKYGPFTVRNILRPAASLSREMDASVETERLP
jgi:glycosyltransferase involved in cell wall biosynthesis